MQKKASDTTDTAAGEAGAPPTPGQTARSPRWRRFMPERRFVATTLVALIGPLVAVTIGTWLYLSGGRYISTDNAYVKADKIAVSADVAGRVAEVLVKADQQVTRGAVLFRLDPEPFRIALERAEARLAAAVQEIDSVRAIYEQKVARLKLAEGDVAFHQQNHDRQDKLTQRGVVSRSGMDTAEKNLRNARDQVAIIQQEMAEVRAKLGGDATKPTAEHPAVREARALRDQAALDLRRTEVRAPAAGIVTNFDMQAGEYVSAGSVVFSLVGTEDVWVQANFKETDLTNVKEGQRATVHIDTYPDGTWTGLVTSISPATGAEFAVLPPQNATGNWVKVVQRLPVRLKLDAAPGARPLRAGMSVVVEIDTGYKRPMPAWAQVILGRAKASP
jgi:membrane fusion protein (multidrug efflux system)